MRDPRHATILPHLLISALLLLPLTVCLTGCEGSADTNTDAPVGQTEQAKAATNAMQDFMAKKAATPAKGKAR